MTSQRADAQDFLFHKDFLRVGVSKGLIFFFMTSSVTHFIVRKNIAQVKNNLSKKYECTLQAHIDLYNLPHRVTWTENESVFCFFYHASNERRYLENSAVWFSQLNAVVAGQRVACSGTINLGAGVQISFQITFQIQDLWSPV